MAGVVICHSSAMIRERLVVTSVGVPALTPVRAAGSVDELVALVRRVPPTVVLLDAHIGAPGAVDAVRALRALSPTTAVVILAMPDDAESLDKALALGARGFLAPEVGRAELAAVAAHVMASPVQQRPMGVAGEAGRPVASAPVGALPHPRSLGASDAPGSAGASVVAPDGQMIVLTKREVEVLVGMSNGQSNSQIGQSLFLSEDTIKTHARRLFRKLGAADRAQAVAIGLRRGLIR
ncbi:response regulator transcription factor [Cellulomonas marina]|uniref:DNA-binding response regulator, NarL/FixJ family, contains REC and HTH domains n=1 Tax=Cellulomonas marina TaxID=988821 RepID=A0A1I0XSS5_9CELL|nr:response regulator transcription factor [Cellulomonas marina]GIG30027.1 DNA-binding response regulator [Cellulomonas marina]SFB03310.1 DNA-binding response regulator, NarL/FixJ family, contains REC and HTH domains [Cellulomonas marina]